jgi:hypothetical protein
MIYILMHLPVCAFASIDLYSSRSQISDLPRSSYHQNLAEPGLFLDKRDGRRPSVRAGRPGPGSNDLSNEQHVQDTPTIIVVIDESRLGKTGV